MQAIHSTTTSVRPASIPVAIYARVSTYSQVGGRFDSCECQVAHCRDYVPRRLWWSM